MSRRLGNRNQFYLLEAPSKSLIWWGRFTESDIQTIVFKGYKEDSELLVYIDEWEKRTNLKKGHINQEFLIE